MPDKEKIALVLGFEVARNSGLFWYDAKTNCKNPYNIFFKDVLSQQGYPCIFCGMTCEQLEDMLATASAYEYYGNGGYQNDRLVSAVQDGQYHSGLSMMSGGACR